MYIPSPDVSLEILSSYAQSETGLIWQVLCATEKLISLKEGGT